MKSNSSRLSRGCAALFLAACVSSTLPAQMVSPTPNQPVPSPTPTPKPRTTPTPTPAPTPATYSAADGTGSHSIRSFMRKASKAGIKEVTVSQAVMDRLSNAQLRSFAQQMVADHTAANTGLTALARQKGVELPASDESSLADEWFRKMDNIDRKYVKEMVSEHEEAVRLFEKASKSSDPDVAAFAQKTLPTLQHHLAMAQDLEKAID